MKKSIFKSFVMTLVLAGSSQAVVSAQDYSFVKTTATSSFDTDFTAAAEKTVNSVVCIKSYATPASSYGNYYSSPFDMFDFFFGPQERTQPKKKEKKSEPVQSGLGSGVIISADGYIVTNNHVVDEAEKLEVLLNDNTTYEATIIGTDEATDLALIKIDAEGLSAITFGDSDATKIGEWVLAVGNPFGFNSTVTAGIISAKSRSLSMKSNSGSLGIEAFIQTDAVLNPGNSGGALVNLKGELIGVNAAIYSNTGSYTGYSFAIPTSIVKKVVTDIKQYGTVQRAVLGVSVAELTSKIAKEKDITATATGVLVVSVNDRSTGRELGLQEDDVIVAINGVSVHTIPELHEQMSRFHPGEQISVTFYRDNKKQTKTGTLLNSKGDTSITKKGDFSDLGCAFTKLTADEKSRLGISYGVKVSGLTNGLFRKYGIKEGTIILSINDEVVNSPDDVEKIVKEIHKSDDPDKVMFITALTSTGQKKYYAVDLNED